MLRKFKAAVFAILTLSLMGSSLALASTKTNNNDFFALQGKVTAVDYKEQTMSIKEEGTGKEYTVVMPESATFKIVFGKDWRRNLPTLENVSVGDIVRIKVRVANERDQVANRTTKAIITKS
jgi:hypothetical protein